MTDQPYTPTTEVIERAFREFGRTNGPISQLLRQDEFDRWLAAIEAAAEQRGAIKALRDAAEDLFYDGDTDRTVPGHSDLLDRADQLEGDGG